MKILLVGNTNNELFRLGVELQKRNLDTTLVLLQSGQLHDPKNLFHMSKYRDCNMKIVDLRKFSEESQVILDPSFISEICNLVNFDFGILDNIGPALSGLLSFPYLTYITGSNLTYYANSLLGQFRSEVWDLDYKNSENAKTQVLKYDKFWRLQVEGIKNSTAIISFPKGIVKAEDTLLESYGIKKEVLTWFYFDDFQFNLLYSKLKFPIHKNLTQIFFGARIDLSNNTHPGNSSRDDKGFNNLIEIVHELNISFKKKYRVTLSNKGKSTHYFKEIIEKQNLNRFFRFIPELNYHSYLKVMRNHDVIIDSLGSSPFGRISLDAISLGKMPIVSTKPETWKQCFPSSTHELINSYQKPSDIVNFIEGKKPNPSPKDLCELNNYQVDKLLRMIK
jgi:hypothetical protein